MDIYLCRHGQSENNLLPVAEHRPDPPLTALGQAQAEMLARPLSARRPALLLSSPLLRALETAGPLAARTGCPWEVWEDLAEAHRAHPDDGLPLPELRRRFPQVRWAPRMRWPGTPGPESEAQARDRAANLVRRLTAAASWPVSISYFEKKSGKGDAVPSYEMSYRFHENGVTSELTIDHGEFAFKGKLKELTFLPEATCPADKPQQ